MSTGAGIAIAGVVIAFAIFITGFGADAPNQPVVAAGDAERGSIMTDLTEDDHVYGNPDAPITIIEYSDFECPFCGRFHPTMETLVDTNPDVKWVYRHFPLGGHRNAEPAAVASECIADLGGNDLFWDFGNHLFENQRELSDELYVGFAKENGIDEAAFAACLEDPKHLDKVEDDMFRGQLAGVTGTPSSVLVTPTGESVPFSGALPIETIQELVDKVRGI